MDTDILDTSSIEREIKTLVKQFLADALPRSCWHNNVHNLKIALRQSICAILEIDAILEEIRLATEVEAAKKMIDDM